MLSDELQYVDLPILPDDECKKIYNVHYRYFNPTNVCVSGEKGSSCNGDSGGGMHVMINGRMTLIALVSFGFENCEGGFPTGMTRITSYLDWISANTRIKIQ
jgi:secreted trypsin-like serine protease